ncbi:aminopeptidase P family protein [Mycoplasmopsis columboralis]|uniref:Xaa-Pro aminopeptidase n=1 Tax=Mycoplasmopsis columboralis TaxID=171282 RepID=A0A449B709_9BACT|nr:aminopeptidase P family protein [Mycoplasmopsis columboralis]VEU76358.1 Xaa-Pro aminopeptidase [Mycoplasmopsis columboralis]
MDRKRLDKMFQDLQVDALISEAPQTRLWYADVQTTDGLIVIEKDKATLFVDSRYIEYCQKHAKNVEVILMQGDSVAKWFDNRKLNSIALESNYLVKDWENRIMSLAKPQVVKWVNAQDLRIIKSPQEIEKMQKVIDITLSAYDEFMVWVKPGVTEKEAAAMLNYLMKKHGADKEGFTEIIASGASSAEPHHHPTEKVIEDNSLLKVDFGALYQGYTADITRTTILGDKSKANPKMLEILQIVEEAAALGRAYVKPGIKASEVDRVCREYIQSKGYGDKFLHGTGHGLGIDVHELPSVSTKSDYILEPGMIITVEPGIYLEGIGGARIEDDVLVTETGRYVFSRPDEQN